MFVFRAMQYKRKHMLDLSVKYVENIVVIVRALSRFAKCGIR